MNSLLSSMRFYEARANLLPRDNSPILAHSVGQLATMTFQKSGIDGLTAPEPLVYAVPEFYACLAQLPAEINLLALKHAGEVNEPDIQILYQAAELVNLLDGLFKGGRSLFPVLFLLQHPGAIHSHAAHYGQPLGEILPLLFGSLVAAFQGNNLLNRRRYAGQQFFGLLESEKPRHHPACGEASARGETANARRQAN